MKKKILCALLAAVMLLSSCDGNAGNAITAKQEEADVFEALSGLNWNMDYEDVLKALPVPNTKYEDNTRDMAGVSYSSVDFFGYDSKLDIYIQSNYRKRQLYRLAFTINTEDISGTYEKIKEMLTEKYGEYKQYTEFVSWEFINDNTTVTLSGLDNELVCSFVYVRKPLTGEFSYNIAYLIDEFFIGTYNSAELRYNNYFLGDYAKPVIYLYPEEETEIRVAIDFKYGGELTCTYPEYNEGWQIVAEPNGTLYDENGDEYYCLYCRSITQSDFSSDCIKVRKRACARQGAFVH